MLLMSISVFEADRLMFGLLWPTSIAILIFRESNLTFICWSCIKASFISIIVFWVFATQTNAETHLAELDRDAGYLFAIHFDIQRSLSTEGSQMPTVQD